MHTLSSPPFSFMSWSTRRQWVRASVRKLRDALMIFFVQVLFHMSINQPKLYECVCGEFALGLDVNLPLLPRRKTDAAYIISKKDRIFVLKYAPHSLA